jgi:hypothetical protein
VIQAQFPNAIAKWFAVAELAGCEATDTCRDPGLGLMIAQANQPRLEKVAAIPGQVVCNPVHGQNVTYTLRNGNA